MLPEDDANRQIANGFLLNPNLNIRAIRILTPSGGWLKAIDSFKKKIHRRNAVIRKKNVSLVNRF